MNNIFSSQQKYKVNLSFSNKPSTSSLIYFYSPIISKDATYLYLFLHKEAQNPFINNVYISQKRLTLLTNLETIDLKNNIKNLEIVGLLNIYINPKEKNKITFVLNEPLDPIKFLKNKTLASTLIDKIGEENVNINSKYFSSSQFKQNTNDVLLTKEITIKPSSNLSNTTNLNIKIDLSLLYELLDKKNIEYINWDASLRRVISDSIILHNFKIEDIVNIIVSILKTYEEINENLYLDFISKNNIPINSKKLNTLLYSNNETTEIQFKLFENINPLELIKVLFDREAKKMEVNLINTLKKNYSLKNEIINLLIHHSKLVNQEIIGNYIKKIADTFAKNKINNLQDASNHLKTAYKLSNKKNNSKINTKEGVENLDF